MEKLNIKVEYIYHSGFTVKTENNLLVFDYYKGDIELSDKTTYVFITHGHEDHFNPQVLDWKRDNKDTNYIISNDIQLENNRDNIHYMAPYKKLDLGDVKVESYGSTDLGLSFLVHVDGLTIFHAGDLNWWYWDNDPVDEKESMEKSFKLKVSRLKNQKVDLAFFPVDPRLGEYYYLGGKHFIDEIQPAYFVPMHFGDKYDIVPKFIHRMKESTTNIVNIKIKNQKIYL